MTPQSKSALTVQYDLRPAKQVERRMLVDAFQRLAQAGFEIRDYKYTGFGAYYFVDFIIFHKLLGINDMLSIEHDKTLERRVRFNCPFECVKIWMDSSTAVIPTLSPDIRHILWLDYDEPITDLILKDMYLAGSQLSSGSILLVTVDTEPPDKDSDDPSASKAYFEKQAEKYLGVLDPEAFADRNLPSTNKRIILNALKDGMSGRTDVNFLPLFYFLYADGHRMMTIGGMIGSKAEKRKINSMNIDGAIYLRTDERHAPYEIRVPTFTPKERHSMNQAMPCPVGWQPAEFEVPIEDIASYREIYRFLPAYAELLI